MPLLKIISGGQTGVDRGALDAALAVHFPCGGRCPAGRKAEDGTIPENYPVTALRRRGYRARTLKNVQDSDGTLILAPGELTGGTALRLRLCRQHGKPHLAIDARDAPAQPAAEAVLRFVEAHRIAVLNVAGPRASGWPAGEGFARSTIGAVLERRRDAAEPGLKSGLVKSQISGLRTVSAGNREKSRSADQSSRTP